MSHVTTSLDQSKSRIFTSDPASLGENCCTTGVFILLSAVLGNLAHYNVYDLCIRLEPFTVDAVSVVSDRSYR